MVVTPAVPPRASNSSLRARLPVMLLQELLMELLMVKVITMRPLITSSMAMASLTCSPLKTLTMLTTTTLAAVATTTAARTLMVTITRSPTTEVMCTIYRTLMTATITTMDNTSELTTTVTLTKVDTAITCNMLAMLINMVLIWATSTKANTTDLSAMIRIATTRKVTRRPNYLPKLINRISINSPNLAQRVSFSTSHMHTLPISTMQDLAIANTLIRSMHMDKPYTTKPVALQAACTHTMTPTFTTKMGMTTDIVHVTTRLVSMTLRRK